MVVVEQCVVADWLGGRKGLEHGNFSWDLKPALDPHDPARNQERGQMGIRRLAIRIHPGRAGILAGFVEALAKGVKYKDTFVIDLTPKGSAVRDLFQQVPGFSGKSLFGGAMTSPERRDLLPSGSVPLVQTLGCFFRLNLSSPLLNTSWGVASSAEG